MPEGHTVHRAARDQQVLVGRGLDVTSPAGTHDAQAKKLHRRPLKAVRAVGKHVFYEFDRAPPATLHVHLALFGKLQLHKAGRVPEPRGAIRLRLAGPTHVLDVRGARTCELRARADVEAIVARLGPDPLDPAADRDRAVDRIARSRAPLATLLMDQSVLSGVGNIYRCETLWMHRIDPMAPGREVPRTILESLWASNVRWMTVGVRYNRIITVPRQPGRPYSKLVGRERFNVYKKPACPRCATPVACRILAGRDLYWCPACQVGTGVVEEDLPAVDDAPVAPGAP